MIAEDYRSFIAGKSSTAELGAGLADVDIHGALFPFQADVARWALGNARAAAFLDTGLGKTIVQGEWARHVAEQVGPVVIAAPLAVAQQTVAECQRLLGMDIGYSRDGRIVAPVTVTNYERLEQFDLSAFSGVVLDESSILKSYMGQTKRFLCDAFARTPYRLACTATPAPNDYMELGNHSAFLSVMESGEMLTRWFINDTMASGKYRLKGHAVQSFWEWVASWAACAAKPSDVHPDYDDTPFQLPPLDIVTHRVASPLEPGADGELFSLPDVSATGINRTQRSTLERRCGLVAELVNGDPGEPWSVWCESNAESALLARLIPDAVEVTGSLPADTKEDRLMAFTEGRARVIVSKPSICGFGMNWQHCARAAVCSVKYSYEQFYQLLRRHWRFGQTRPVQAHVVIPDSELPVWRAIEAKTQNHDAMKAHMRYAKFAAGRTSRVKAPYEANHVGRLPDWLMN